MNSATRSAPRLGRSTRWLIIGGIAAAILVAGAGLLYLFGRSTPSAVGLGGTASSSASSTAASTAAAGSTSGSGATTADLTGTWTVDATVGSFSDYSSSFVGYRVQEELANVGAATAVGRTPDVTGTLVVEGTSITSVEITADLTTLKSDNDMRDGQLDRQGLETATYPTATFALTEPIQLAALPQDGETISATAIGDLTIHGVTKSVQVPIQAQRNRSVVTVVGSIDITFADYGMTAPQSMMVLSIADTGVMEFQLHFTQ